MRLMQTQLCPAFVPTLAPTSVGIATSRSASSRRMPADLPPSSSVTGRTSLPQASATRAPIASDPVNETLSTSGWLTRYSDISGPAATTLITPGGKPASVIRSHIAKIASGSGSGTLTTAVQPTTTAGAIFCATPGSGKLYAVNPATTPIGSLTTTLRPA